MPVFTAIGTAILGSAAASAAAGTAATIGLAATGAAAAAAGAGYGIVAGERGAAAQEKAMNQQKQAQDAAVAQARSQQRRSQQAMAAANRQEPNVANIMGRAAAEMGNSGASTMLTGPTGVNPMDLSLGRSSLLGS